MTNPNIELDTRVPALPCGFSSYFDWEVNGIKYRYTVSTDYLYYIGSDLGVYGNLVITKSQYRTWRGLKWRSIKWTVRSSGHVGFLESHDVFDKMLSSAAKAGVMPSELLVDRCLALARQPIVKVRDAALAAKKAASERRNISAA